MSDRFPYDTRSREALVQLIRVSENMPNLRDDLVTFEDLYFAPTASEPGRTFIEMIDLETQIKSWYSYRRIDIANQKCLGPAISIIIQGDPTPANIVREINRAYNMNFDPSDLSYSNELLPVRDNQFVYSMSTLSGSYVYYGTVKVSITVVPTSRWTRYTEIGYIRYTEDSIERTLEHRISRWS